MKKMKNEKRISKQIIISNNEIDKFVKIKELKRDRKIVKFSFFDWLINYIPTPTKN